MNKFVLFIWVVFIYSCSGGCNQSQDNSMESPSTSSGEFVPASAPTGNAIGQGFDIEAHIEKKGRILGNACSIVPKRTIAEALNVDVRDIYLRNSTPRDEKRTHTSCFFKWDDPELSNAGIMLQMMRNPNEEEFIDYAKKFIEAFRVRGERGVEPGEVIMYEKFEGFGDDGSYSTEGGKYFWRLGDKIIFGIAFNTLHTAQEQYQIATTLAKVMTENYMR